MNVKKLRSHMALEGDTQQTLADAIDMSRSRLNAKINGTGGADFSLREMRRVADRYGLSAEEAGQLFFTDEVS